MSKLYLDRRTNEIVDDLNTTTIPPELWIELEVSDYLEGAYRYTYGRGNQRLDITFTDRDVEFHPDGLSGYLDEMLKLNGFTNSKLLQRVKYVSSDSLIRKR